MSIVSFLPHIKSLLELNTLLKMTATNMFSKRKCNNENKLSLNLRLMEMYFLNKNELRFMEHIVGKTNVKVRDTERYTCGIIYRR